MKKRYTIYINKVWLPAWVILVSLLLTNCSDRRDLWVLADEYRQLELVTDWSEADEYPGGMTAWFIANDYSGYTYNTKTAEVEHTWLALPRGGYTGFVFDYSPEEYSHNEFIYMDDPEKAQVHLRPSAYQPDPNDSVNKELFGPEAVSKPMDGLEIDPNTGLYIVKAEPDPINLDVLGDVEIVSGTKGDYVLWNKRKEYEESLVTQTLYAKPKPILWRLRVEVNVKGIYYMSNLRASVVGLADGYWMTKGQHTEEVCIRELNNWETRSTGDNVGIVSTSTMSFGLPENVNTRDVITYYIRDLRLNLSFLLRDEETVKNYHFDCEPLVEVNEDQLLVRIYIPLDMAPELPYVMPKNGAGFDADVTPWENGGTAEATM